MSDLPALVRQPFGASGSLGRDYATGGSRATTLLPVPGASSGTGSASRLSADAFGVSNDGTREKLKRILAGEGFLIGTGQQPVLLLGPMFVLYKALTAVALAEELERELGEPVLASFWIASDDHDWEEVASTRLIDTENRLRLFRLEPRAGRAGRSVGESALGDGVRPLLDEIRQALPDSEFIGDYMKSIERAYAPAHTFSEAFAGALSALLPEHEMVWLDSSSAGVKRAAAPLMRRALQETGAAAEALERGSERVEAAGYGSQLARPVGAANIFHDGEGGRRRVYVEDDAARIGRDGSRVPLGAVLEQLESSPERFGPSAALRPVMESWLLPIGASVLGPAEIAYWAQLPELFAWAESRLPTVVPRTGWTVVERKIGKVLGALDVEPAALEDGGRALAARVLEEERPPGVAEALARLERTREGAFDEVAEAVAKELPGIAATVEKARSGSKKIQRELERAVDAAVRGNQGIARGMIEKAATHLYPDGAPQERVQSPLYYLSRYGERFMELLDREVRVVVKERGWRLSQPAGIRR